MKKGSYSGEVSLDMGWYDPSDRTDSTSHQSESNDHKQDVEGDYKHQKSQKEIVEVYNPDGGDDNNNDYYEEDSWN